MNPNRNAAINEAAADITVDALAKISRHANTIADGSPEDVALATAALTAAVTSNAAHAITDPSEPSIHEVLEIIYRLAHLATDQPLSDNSLTDDEQVRLEMQLGPRASHIALTLLHVIAIDDDPTRPLHAADTANDFVTDEIANQRRIDAVIDIATGITRWTDNSPVFTTPNPIDVHLPFAVIVHPYDAVIAAATALARTNPEGTLDEPLAEQFDRDGAIPTETFDRLIR